MAKSMVERYEQLLLQDPQSAVFVELAKVLLEKGEHSRAMEVCQQGLGHHPQSVIGRVLWGKALLHLGKPAQAMEQFDQAIAVDKENAHAYNLIGEVLVHRGLFRSALPILRKAAALQPNDGRVKLWLDQTQQALSGGPAPVMADLPALTANELAPKPLEEVQPAPKAAPAEPAAPPAPPPEALQAQPPQPSAPPPPPAETQGLPPEADDMGGDDITRSINISQLQLPEQAAPPSEAPSSGPTVVSAPGKVKVYMFPPRPRAAPPPPPPEEDDLADTPPPFGGRHEPEEHTPITLAAAPETPPPPPAEGSGGLLPDVDAAGAEASAEAAGAPVPSDEPQTQVETSPAGRSTSSGGGLLGDLPHPDEEDLPAVPAAARASDSAKTPTASRSRGAKAGSKRSLLDDIPEAAEPQAAAAPRAAASQVDAAAAAAAYEKELREKIAKKAENPSFLARYGVKLGVAAVVLLVLGVGLGVYRFRRAQQGGQTLIEVLERTERAISLDTRTSLKDALAMLDRALEMDDGNSRAWALSAYTHALLYADHGGLAEERQQALMALDQSGVRSTYPGLSLATDVLVADDKARPAARKALLESKIDDSSELHTLAGALLLEEKKPEKALEHFKRALDISSRNVRALVAIGQYYQDFEDYPSAFKVYTTAREISPEHTLARIGLAESRLALGQELDMALADVQGVGDATVTDMLRPRQQLIQGRLLAELGRYKEALPLLESGTKGPLAFDFQLALGEASRDSGDLPKAQQAYEAALALQPKSEAAREGLGRTLLDRDRVKEALEKLAGSEGRRVSLVRAAAYARQSEWKRVRQELEKTKVNNRYVPEAVAYLAMADTLDGNGGDQAREVLEKAVAGSKQPRPELRLALGRVYWQQSTMDKAQTQFEEAMKDARDYEAPCSLGRLMLARGLPDLALKPLAQAVERNGFHGEARDALGKALLALGRTDEGFKQFEEWKKQSPENPEAQRGYAFALFHTGQRQQAADAIHPVKLSANDAAGYRLKAQILFATGDSKGGIAALQIAAKLGANPETFCEMAQVFLRQDKKDEAANAYDTARKEGPDTPCGLIGEHYVDPAEGGKASAEALKAIAGKATAVWDKAFAQATIARVLLSANNVKAAHAAAEEAVKLVPYDARAQLALGLVAVKEKQVDAAITALTKATEYDPLNGMAHLALADVLVRKQDELPHAIQEYEAFLKLAGSSNEAKRVKKALPLLKKRVK